MNKFEWLAWPLQSQLNAAHCSLIVTSSYGIVDTRIDDYDHDAGTDGIKEPVAQLQHLLFQLNYNVATNKNVFAKWYMFLKK